MIDVTSTRGKIPFLGEKERLRLSFFAVLLAFFPLSPLGNFLFLLFSLLQPPCIFLGSMREIHPY
jgi:hypothetical protein